MKWVDQMCTDCHLATPPECSEAACKRVSSLATLPRVLCGDRSERDGWRGGGAEVRMERPKKLSPDTQPGSASLPGSQNRRQQFQEMHPRTDAMFVLLAKDNAAMVGAA